MDFERRMQKKGFAGWQLLEGIVAVIAIFIAVFYIIGGLASSLNTAATQISSQVSLFGSVASIFAAGGPLFILFLIFVFIALLGSLIMLVKGKWGK